MSILRYLDLPNLTSIVCDYGYSDNFESMISVTLESIIQETL